MWKQQVEVDSVRICWSGEISSVNHGGLLALI